MYTMCSCVHRPHRWILYRSHLCTAQPCSCTATVEHCVESSDIFLDEGSLYFRRVLLSVVIVVRTVLTLGEGCRCSVVFSASAFIHAALEVHPRRYCCALALTPSCDADGLSHAVNECVSVWLRDDRPTTAVNVPLTRCQSPSPASS